MQYAATCSASRGFAAAAAAATRAASASSSRGDVAVRGPATRWARKSTSSSRRLERRGAVVVVEVARERSGGGMAAGAGRSSRLVRTAAGAGDTQPRQDADKGDSPTKGQTSPSPSSSMDDNSWWGSRFFDTKNAFSKKEKIVLSRL